MSTRYQRAGLRGHAQHATEGRGDAHEVTAVARLTVRVTPRASRSEVGAFDLETGVLRVRISAPPVDGRANQALTRLLASHLGVPRGAVRVVGGASARTKRVEVEGLTAEELQARLSGG